MYVYAMYVIYPYVHMLWCICVVVFKQTVVGK